MTKESRVKKSLINARVNMICYMVSLLVAFFTRKILLDQLGTEFIGLTSTLQSLLEFLNLAELGVGTAIGYVLYQPIFDNDYKKINEIISVFGYLYRCIGLIILCIGIILSFFLPKIFSNTSFSWGVIYLGFYAYLASSMLGYFVNYKQTLLSADQRNYEVTGYYQAVTSAKMILQMILALYVKSFILFFIIEITFGIIYSFILTARINKVYPWLRSNVKLGRKLFKKYPEIGKYVKQLFVHKIGGFVQIQIMPILIYSYISLPMVALYGNYTQITQKVQGFISGILDSTGAGVGNLISEGNKTKIYKTYKELFSIRIFAAGILSACVYFLCSPFISLWLGTKYLLSDQILLLITLQFFMLIARGATDQFLFGFGLFYDIWAPLVEAGIFMASSILLGSIWGLKGVLCGPLISMGAIVYIWKPYFLFSKGFKIPFTKYCVLFIIHLVTMLGAYLLSTHICYHIIRIYLFKLNWLNWILESILFVIVMTLISTILLCCTSSGMRNFLKRFIKLERH